MLTGSCDMGVYSVVHVFLCTCGNKVLGTYILENFTDSDQALADNLTKNFQLTYLLRVI